MPNKLTDTEVKKALECCAKNASCTDCPLRETKSNCGDYFLDLFNRQEQEIKTLQDEYRWLDQECGALLKEVNAENESLKAEVERLKPENKYYKELEQGCYVTGVKNIKAEAYKEAFDKVKEELKNIAKIDWKGGYYYLVGEAFFDNLLNELVGDGDGGN